MIRLQLIDKIAIRVAQRTVTEHHYLHKPIDTRCSIEGYWIYSGWDLPGPAGIFLFGRPQATGVKGWYGPGADCTYWQVLNLARVRFHPDVQRGGVHYGPAWLPGFVDRHGDWRSTAVSAAISALVARVGSEYLQHRPPVFLDEPYEIPWLLGYCDTHLHRGTIYQAAGFERLSINAAGIETWRIALPRLTAEQHRAIRRRSAEDQRAQRYQARSTRNGGLREGAG